VDQAGKFTIGHGFLLGFTLSIRKFDINFNYTNRKRPIRILPGYSIDEIYLLYGISFNPGFFEME
jgi:hypothetical protein